MPPSISWRRNNKALKKYRFFGILTEEADFFGVCAMSDVTNIHIMKPLLAEHGFHFSKAKGQNFLIAAWVPEQIALEAGVDTNVFHGSTLVASPWEATH